MTRGSQYWAMRKKKGRSAPPLNNSLKCMLLVFDNAPYRFHVHVCLREQFFNAFAVRSAPAADRLTVLFVYVGFVHAEAASSRSSNNGFSRRDYLLLGHLWKCDQIFRHNHLLRNCSANCGDVKVYDLRSIPVDSTWLDEWNAKY